MKKALSLLLTLCLIMSVCALPASAAVSISFNSTNVEILDAAQGTLKVTGQINDTNPGVLVNRYVTILVLPQGSAPSQYDLAKAMVTVEADTDGKFEKTFTFTEIGTFSFYAIYETYTSACANVEIKGVASAAAVVKNIENGTIAKGSIAAAIANHGQMGVDLDRFQPGFDRDLFEYRIDKNRRDIDVTGTDVEVMESFYALVDKAEGEAAFVKAFNNTTYQTEFITLMRANAAYIKDISFAAYDALGDNGKIYVQDAFIGKTYYNADDIKLDFDALVAAAPKDITSDDDKGPTNNDREWGGALVGGGGAPAVTPVAPAIKPAVSFTDIASVSWAKEAIETLTTKGIVSGTSETTYEPNGLVTREQFAKLIVLASGKYDANATADFKDIPAGDWSTSYVASAKAAGFINGVGEGNFGYGASITREDMAVMIYNVMKANGVKFDGAKTDFADYSNISDYAKEAVSALAAKGIINGVGDNQFAPKATATRAQAAVLVYAIVKGVA